MAREVTVGIACSEMNPFILLLTSQSPKPVCSVTRVVRLTTSLRAQELVVMCVGDLGVCV